MAEKEFNTATGKTTVEDAKRRASRMMKEKAFFEEKAGEHRGKLHSTQTLEKLDQDQKHGREQSALDDKLGSSQQRYETRHSGFDIPLM